METRSFQLADLRADDGDDSRRVRGTAIVYGQDADLKVFRERIQPGALRSVLASGRNMRLLFEHDRRGLLASTEAGSLRVFDTPAGLTFEARIAATTTGNDVLTLVRGGELRGMSFGFNVARGGQAFTREAGKLLRTITEFAEVPEITITSAPAYDTTNVAQRSIDPQAIAEAERMLGRPSLQDRRRQLRAAQAAA
ncbi:MAG: HK97 family phage prohead protease [Planctomycetota bacterium]